jgi:hypothetical protein
LVYGCLKEVPVSIYFVGYFLISDVSKVPIDEKFYHEESNANRLGNDSAFVYRCNLS